MTLTGRKYELLQKGAFSQVQKVWKKERKVIASFQIANGEERRHVMCVGARSGSNPGPLGSEPSALTNCASCLTSDSAKANGRTEEFTDRKIMPIDEWRDRRPRVPVWSSLRLICVCQIKLITQVDPSFALHFSLRRRARW